MNASRQTIFGLGLVVGMMFFANLGGPALWDEDEPRNAQCAVEMMQRGDWVVPYFNGEVRTHKPVLLYWLMIASYSLFGVSEFSARLPSALMATGTLAATYLMGIRLFNRRTAALAVIALATALMFTVSARAATPDAVLICCSTWAIACFVMGSWDGARAESRTTIKSVPSDARMTTLMYAWMGLAVLAKGPVGFLLPAAVIGMFLLLQRLPETGEARDGWMVRWVELLRPLRPLHFLRTCLSMRLGVGIIVILAVALPWYIWVTIRSNGVWTYGFFFEHNLGRAMRAMENHGGPPLIYYMIALCFGFFPWSVFFGPCVIDLVRDWNANHRDRAARTFLLCWVGVYVVLFSFASTKLPSYISPCYPAVALLMAAFVDRMSRREVQVSRLWPQLGLAILMLVGLAVVVGVPVAAAEFVPGAEWIAVLGLVPLVGGGVALWRYRAERDASAVQWTVATACCFGALTFGLAATEVSKHQRISELIENARLSGEAAELATFAGFRSSWVFYANQTVRKFHRNAPDEARDYLSASPDRLLIVPESAVDVLGDDIDVLAKVPWFMKQESLLLVGDRRFRTARVSTSER